MLTESEMYDIEAKAAADLAPIIAAWKREMRIDAWMRIGAMLAMLVLGVIVGINIGVRYAP
jgi:hypothetical protein